MSGRVPLPLRPAAALIAADLLLLARPNTRPLRAVIALAVPGLAVASGATGATLATAFAAGALAAATSAAEGARRARELPVLLPLSDRRITVARMATPAIVLIPWTAAAGALAGLSGTVPGPVAGWVVLALLSVPAWASGAVRAARRPAADFTLPAVETPFGPVPPGVVASLLRGPDVALLGASPLLIAMITSSPSPGAVVAQVVTSTLTTAFFVRS